MMLDLQKNIMHMTEKFVAKTICRGKHCSVRQKIHLKKHQNVAHDYVYKTYCNCLCSNVGISHYQLKKVCKISLVTLNNIMW